MDLKQFDLVLIDFPKLENESIQSGKRPALIYSNDKCNAHSPVVSVIPFTSRKKKWMPTHLYFDQGYAKTIGLPRASTLLGECVTPASKSRIIVKLGTIQSPTVRQKIHDIVDVQFGKKKADRMVSIICLDSREKAICASGGNPERREVMYV